MPETTGHEILPQIPGFRLEREIGRGATSRVFLARQESLDRPVAMKIIAALGEKGQRRALRLFREARLAGALDHPGIVRGIDAGIAEGLCWFAMEYVEGRDLEQLVRERGPLPLHRVLDIAEQILSALDHAHRRGVIHRDIKPANVLIDSRGRARLLDLGLARRERDPRLTLDSGTLGTPLYMSPEHARSPDRVDGRSDLFSAASTFYLALAGRAPFEAPSVTAVITRLLYDEPDPPSSIVKGVPEAVDLVLLKALSKPRHLRYADAAHFLADIRALRQGRRPELADAPAERNFRRPLAVGAAVVLAAAGVAWLAGRRDDGPQAEGIEPARREERASIEFDELSALGAGSGSLRGLDACRRVRELRQTAGLAPDDDPGGALSRVDGDLLRDLSSAVAVVEAEAAGALARSVPEEAESAARKIANCDPAPKEALEAIDPELAARAEEVRQAGRDRIAAAVAAWRAGRLKSALEVVGFTTQALSGIRAPILDAKERLEKALADAGYLQNGFDDEGWGIVRSAILAAADEVEKAQRSRWKALHSQVENLCERKRWRDARSALEAALPDARAVGQRAEDEAATALAAIEKGSTGDLERLRAGLERVRRVAGDPIDAEEQSLRLQDVSEALEVVRDRVDQIEGAAEIFELAASVAWAGGEAAGLRAAMAAAAARVGGPEGPRFRPVHQGELHSLRRLDGVDPEGRVVFVRESDKARFAYASRDIGIGTLVEILDGAGASPSPAAVAMLAYWEADEAEASSRSEAVADAPLKSFLTDLAASGTVAKSRRFETERERDAFVEFQRCRHLAVTGRTEEARDLLKRVSAALPKGPHGGSSFWAEFLRSRPAFEGVLDREAVLAPWARLRKHLTTADHENGFVRLESSLRDGGSLEAWEVPAGARPDDTGVLIPMPPEERFLPPAGRPALRLPLPDLSGTDVDLRLTITFVGEEPPAYLGIALHDLCFLGVGRLAHGEAFRGEPLHGREHGLLALRAFERAAVWVGPFEQNGPALRSAKQPFRPEAGTEVRLTVEVRDRGRSAAMVVGPERYELATGQDPRLSGRGLRIVGAGTIRIRDLSLTVRHPAPGAGR